MGKRGACYHRLACPTAGRDRVEGHQGRQNFYQSAISREAYQREETESFVRQIHGGSYRSLFAALCPPGGLSAVEAEELRRWFEGGAPGDAE